MFNMKHVCRLGLGSYSMLPPKTGFFGITIRNLRKIVQASQYHPMTYEYFRSYPEIVAERQKQLFELGNYMIHPLSLFNLVWNSIMILINLAHMTISTLRFIYIIQPPYTTQLHILDKMLLALHIVCFMDMIIKINVGIIDNRSETIMMDRTLVIWRYLKSWLIIDLLSCTPLAYILLYLCLPHPRYILTGHIMALLRTTRIYQVILDLKNFMRLFTGSYVNQGCVQHVMLFAMTVHWSSCLIYLPSALHLYWYGYIPESYNTFLITEKEQILMYSVRARYRRAMFMSISAYFGTGFSTFKASYPAEIIIQSILILYATMFMVYTLVLLLNMYMTVFSTTIRYYALMDQVEEYMKQKQFPMPLKKRVRMFYRYRYQETYFVENSVLECLSDELRNEITLHTCHKLVNKVTLFEGLSASLVGTILGCVSPEVYLPNDSVQRAGDIGDCMYFIASGTVAVYSLKGVEVCHLEDGGHFGEVALLMKDRKRVATVVAVEITQLYRLDSKDFGQFILPQKVLLERIQALASQRMHETVLVDEELRREREKQLNLQERQTSDATVEDKESDGPGSPYSSEMKE